ncbi:hypothetical protein [Streptomyces sp. NPDC049585]|uniref:hypothetical protein n=1 Tax=Streptomyces sp. NPDC049585 TaxID=3155154 RepID=UPI00343C3FE2
MTDQLVLPSAPDGLVAAFPSRLADDVCSVLSIMPVTKHAPAGPIQVEVLGEPVSVPYRIYHDELDARMQNSLTGIQRIVLHCLYSRHHDGRVRQHHLGQMMTSAEAWIAPFVVQLAGEYVLEILEAIRRGLSDLCVPGSAQRALYGQLLAHNPSFFARTERRIVSYWSCYHRRSYPAFHTYPGSAMAEAFRDAASEQPGTLAARQTPRPVRIDSTGTYEWPE